MATCLLVSSSNFCELPGLSQVKETVDSPEYDHFRTMVILLCAIIQMLGNPLCLAIWSYERYGGDPQKRTIINRLMGDLVRQGILINVTGLATFTIRLAFGPVPTFVAHAFYYVSNQAMTISVLFSLNEMAMLKLLSIFAWKRLPPINEEFFGLFLMMMNHSIALLFALYGRMGGSNDIEMYFILTGLPLLTISGEPIFR